MYICLDCLKVFENPQKWVETHGLYSPPYEEWGGCPKCGGTYVIVNTCSQCGKYISIDYIKLKDGDYVCEDCYVNKSFGEE